MRIATLRVIAGAGAPLLAVDGQEVEVLSEGTLPLIRSKNGVLHRVLPSEVRK